MKKVLVLTTCTAWDPSTIEAYVRLAAPIFEQHGGLFVGNGNYVKTLEEDKVSHTVLAEFQSAQDAADAIASSAHPEAIQVLGTDAECVVSAVETPI